MIRVAGPAMKGSPEMRDLSTIVRRVAVDTSFWRVDDPFGNVRKINGVKHISATMQHVRLRRGIVRLRVYRGKRRLPAMLMLNVKRRTTYAYKHMRHGEGANGLDREYTCPRYIRLWIERNLEQLDWRLDNFVRYCNVQQPTIVGELELGGGM
jgi:hypothetical protein